MESSTETKAEIEARARTEGAIAEQLRQHDTRLTANHDSIAELRERMAGHQTSIKVIATEVTEVRADVAEMTSRIQVLGRNFYVAAAALAGLMLSVVGLIVTILGAS